MNSELIHTNHLHAERLEVRELTLLALCNAYLAAGLSARHALSSAMADYACGFGIGDAL